MIVDSMTHAEVYQELARDRDSISAWWAHKLDAQRRRALKSTRFPLFLWFEHTSPRRNRYLFYTCIMDKRMKKVMTGIFVPRYMQDGMTVYSSWLAKQIMRSPLIFTPHMLRRYAERAKVQKSGIELLKHFVRRNPFGKANYNEKLMPRSVRYNGDEHQASCLQDGILLGYITDGIFVASTFITYEMTSGQQQKEFEAGRNQLVSMSEMHDRLTYYY